MVRPPQMVLLLLSVHSLLNSTSPCFTYTLLTGMCSPPDPQARRAPPASLLKGNKCPRDSLNLRGCEGLASAAGFLGN